MVVIGLTGGIGCGKSFVADKMRSRGIPVYDCDSNAKRIMATDNMVVEALKELVGESLYSNGIMNKGMLADFIFGNDGNIHAVNAIVHPAVRADIARWLCGQTSDLCLVESAILFESGFQDCVQFVVTVNAPEELRIRRCMARDGVGRESVARRISSQMPQQEKCLRADFVIENDGVHDLDSQIGAVIDKCKKLSNNSN